MSPAEILAAARSNVVGSYVPAKDEWLKGWTGPAEEQYMPIPIIAWTPIALLGRRHGYRHDHHLAHGLGIERGVRAENIRLDTRRQEVRHLLCDLGVAPEWARGSAVACWCAGVGVAPEIVFPAWALMDRRSKPWERTMGQPGVIVGVYRFGWVVKVGGRVVAKGPETGDLGRACADVAALRARCILTEPDGYYVPLADGGIGWWTHG